ncbi:STAS/SEC14 domain-containing protein [Paraferrimonas sedimenticola]|uniref:STAS domain-containing protein n=1 Tax=Paraferrimonas sedimenticola TaxID=375674 RepID=A0AA37W0U3_9GAMM|nr:STAS/SEC14 domain-containing protein [Paraferrimonas sedimenticola]GLP96013.1 hypothetical protein GCM10007895_13190 [Paraferrimonas sedimenticola]
MLSIAIRGASNCIVVNAQGSVKLQDFELANSQLNQQTADGASFSSLVIYIHDESSRQALARLFRHLNFVLAHRGKFTKVAIICDNPIGGMALAITRLASSAKVVRFYSCQQAELQAFIGCAIGPGCSQCKQAHCCG